MTNINKFIDLLGYKINIRKSIMFLYTSNENEIKKPINISIKKKKICRNKFDQRLIYTENNKTIK